MFDFLKDYDTTLYEAGKDIEHQIHSKLVFVAMRIFAECVLFDLYEETGHKLWNVKLVDVLKDTEFINEISLKCNFNDFNTIDSLCRLEGNKVAHQKKGQKFTASKEEIREGIKAVYEFSVGYYFYKTHMIAPKWSEEEYQQVLDSNHNPNAEKQLEASYKMKLAQKENEVLKVRSEAKNKTIEVLQLQKALSDLKNSNLDLNQKLELERKKRNELENAQRTEREFKEKLSECENQAENIRETLSLVNYDVLEGLNEEQKSAVTTIDGNVRVIAGAGSGKTKALTHRYAYLVKECGIAPSSILSVTFTNKAAQEMKERIRGMIGDQDLGYICTFHGLCLRILREDIHYLHYPQNFTVLDQDDQDILLSDVYDTLNINDFTLPYSEARKEIIQKKSNFLSYYISNVTDPNGFYPKKSNLFSEYLKLQRKNYALDFSDLLYFVIYLFENFQSVREKWQDRFEYIQVDEFQDVSKTEFDLVHILASKHKNLFIVGDPDQTIYSWRGAQVDYILDFDKIYNNVCDIKMLRNYRSSKDIIENSNSLINHNRKRIPKSLSAASDAQINSSPRVIHFHAKTQIEECSWIANKIKELNNLGYDNKDIAILYRMKYAVASLEGVLRSEEIPYKICDGISFYNRPEIKTIFAYFTFIINQDDISFKKIINNPPREMGTSRMSFLKKVAKDNDISLYEALEKNIDNLIFSKTKATKFLKDISKLIENSKDAKVSDILDAVLSVTGYEMKLMTENNDEEFNSIAELKQQIFEAENSRGEKMTLQNYLDDVLLATSNDNDEGKSRVNLMTVHSSKGLEFRAVFCCQMNEGTFPSSRTDTIDKMEEERRIAYVALTRARERLYMTDSEGMSENATSARYTSRFIQNISTELFDFEGEYSDQYDEKKAAQMIFNSENNLDKTESHRIGDIVAHDVYGNGEIENIDVSTDSYIIRFSDDIKKINRREHLVTVSENLPTEDAIVLESQNKEISFNVGDIVEHKIFGKGIIKAINAYKHEITVKFDKYETDRNIYGSNKLQLIKKSNTKEMSDSNLFSMKYSVNDKIYHSVYGFGIVTRIENTECFVKFVSGAEKSISLEKNLIKITDEQYDAAFQKSIIKCPECSKVLPIGTSVCTECGYEFR